MLAYAMLLLGQLANFSFKSEPTVKSGQAWKKFNTVKKYKKKMDFQKKLKDVYVMQQISNVQLIN